MCVYQPCIINLLQQKVIAMPHDNKANKLKSYLRFFVIIILLANYSVGRLSHAII